MGRRPWSVDVIPGVPAVPDRDEPLTKLAFDVTGAEGIGLGPAVTGADGISGKEICSAGEDTGAIGVGVVGGRLV
jgi:hypothetical protein